jgi:hypothetical protein
MVERGGTGELYFQSQAAEGSHNGIAAVLKTAGRKAMQVRLLSPPPFPTFCFSPARRQAKAPRAINPHSLTYRAGCRKFQSPTGLITL